MENSFDLHIYTNNTEGGNDKVSFLCEAAAAKGLRAVAFTDRCDIDRFDRYDSKRRLRHSFFDMARAKSVFFDSPLVLCGIEFTQALANPELTAKIIAGQNYDIVLTSVTGCPGKGGFDRVYDMTQEEFNGFALEYSGLLKMTVERTDFDVLSKILAPLRGVSADTCFFAECIKPVLKALAEKEKALEVNTKDLTGSDKLRELYVNLLKDFKAVGGKYITVGSESYFYDEVGKGTDIAHITAKLSDFEHITLFDKRIPYLIKI